VKKRKVWSGLGAFPDHNITAGGHYAFMLSQTCIGIKTEEGKHCYRFSTGHCYKRPIMLQEGIEVVLEGENIVLRVCRGG